MRRPKATRNRFLLPVLVAPFALAVGCGAMFGSSGSERITAPQASRSPKMDFDRIGTIAVFPLFPAGQVDEPEFAEGLVASLTEQVARHQSQWKIQSYRETLGFISQADLGAGYKNLQADFNTFGGPGGQIVMSPATREFMRRLASVSGADAFIIGSYNLGVQARQTQNPFTGAAVRYVDACEVRLSVYYAPDDENWWTAAVTRAGSRDFIRQEISSSLGAYLGKGTLRQL
ncbi:MAG: hypothetical protein J0L61_10090 [Planctomycetes bacterium]|nr:hypothetical protein [Planctomycetota bacterium]